MRYDDSCVRFWTTGSLRCNAQVYGERRVVVARRDRRNTLASSVTSIGQWSEPMTLGYIRAPRTNGMAAGDART